MKGSGGSGPDEASSLRTALETLENNRPALGDETVDTAIRLLRERLRVLEGPGARQLRKYVTVVFADVTGFTAICEAHDAEYVTGLINTLWNQLDSVIVRYGGVIDKHIGDAVMAIWGSEKVREDDTLRAIRAALAMQESAQGMTFDDRKGISGFRMRVGVHSGPVFLGSIGLKGEYTAMGDTVNIASRLQSTAPEGSVIVSHDAYRHVRGAFTFEPREPVMLKGLDSPLRTWVVVSSAPRRSQQAGPSVMGTETRMVGRDLELEALTSVMKEVMETRKPFMVTVSGEAGIGKSRLLHEFRRKVENQDEDAVFFNARCTPEMKNVPCSVFRDILRFRMNVMEDDTAESALGKFRNGMGRYLSEDEICLGCHYAGFDLSRFEPVKKLMGTPSLGAEGISALIRYFGGTCRDNRTLMYLEDLHWADSTSLDLICGIMSHVVDGSLLLLALTRPPLFESRPDWGTGLPGLRMELRPLTASESSELVGEILERVTGLPEKLAGLITDTAEGNPFYMEELVAMLVDKGVIAGTSDGLCFLPGSLQDWKVPSTLTGVLQARLDSLPDPEKHVLQKAAVIGRIFWDKAVAELSEHREERELDGHLCSVQSRDLVHENDDSTFMRSREYLFKHAILRDVTYDTVLLDSRKDYHRRTADWLLSQSGDRTSEVSGLIAEHYYRGEDWERAAQWLIRSGRSAFSTSSYTESLFAFQRALDIMPDNSSAEERAGLHLMTGKVLDKLTRYDEAMHHLETAREIASGNDIPAITADALLGLAWLATVRGNRELAREMGTGAHLEAERSGDRAILARAIMRMADFDEENSYESKLGYYHESYNIYSELDDLPGLAITALNMGNHAMVYDRIDEGETYYSESLQYYEKLGNKWGIANCLGNLGNVAFYREDFQSSRDLHIKSRDISTMIGDLEGVVICSLNLGRDELNLGNPEKGFGHFCEALRLAVDLGITPLALGALYEMSRRMRAEGDYEDAAIALLCIMNNRGSFLEKGPEIDPDSDLEEVRSGLLPGTMAELADFVSASSLSDIANRLLRGRT
ncbi:MAG: AAA family ATPase [Candidatus Fermentibacteraceae bacterium]|nr:AAA family ATPase [Candidatus Fermentibacteraceae bacterium]